MSMYLMADGTTQPCEMKVVELTKQRDMYKKQSIAGYKLLTDLEFWRDMPAQEMRLRCGEMSTQEMRTVRAVLSIILSTNGESESR
jgi:murein L,D-transpeptidase YcbB/YkuD